MDVKQRLQELMDERNWTIYKVAKEADIPWSTVRNMFKRNTDPSITTLESICRGMGITLYQFFDIDNQQGLSQEQMHILAEWNKLSGDKKRIISELLDALNSPSHE